MTDYSKICYKRNYLDKVIARIDFVNPMEDIGKTLPSRVGKAIRPIFPITEPQKTVHHELIISPDDKTIDKETQFTQWMFHGMEREKTLVLNPSFIVASYFKYDRYDTLKDEFEKIITSILLHYQDLQPSRLGLRYINTIKIGTAKPLNWKAYINAKLLSVIDFSSHPERISRAFHNLEHYFDNYNLRFQFGIHNSDYPQPIKKREFILDYDAYSNILTDPAEIIPTFDKFHSCIQIFFEQSITEKLRRHLNA